MNGTLNVKICVSLSWSEISVGIRFQVPRVQAMNEYSVFNNIFFDYNNEQIRTMYNKVLLNILCSFRKLYGQWFDHIECSCGGDKCCGMILCSILLLFHFPVNNSRFTILWNTGNSCCGAFTLCYLETPTLVCHTFSVSVESALVRTDDGVGVRERKNEYEGCETWGVSTLVERYTVDTSRVSPLLRSYCFTSFSTVQTRHHALCPTPFPSLLFTLMSQRSVSLIVRFHFLVYVSIWKSAVSISFTYSPVMRWNFLLYYKYIYSVSDHLDYLFRAVYYLLLDVKYLRL
jgi:hypothetical protein